MANRNWNTWIKEQLSDGSTKTKYDFGISKGSSAWTSLSNNLTAMAYNYEVIVGMSGKRKTYKLNKSK